MAITFQFDDKQPFQLAAIQSVVDLFRSLPKYAGGLYGDLAAAARAALNDSARNVDIVTGQRLADNLRAVQLRNGLFTSADAPGDSPHFSVESERHSRIVWRANRRITRTEGHYVDQC